MPGKIILSTAYLPPLEYFASIRDSDEIYIEREENYIKQTYRNRCYILTAGGKQLLTVPVYAGSFHKTPVKEIRIDYSKRWQQVHSGALISAYNSSPYFQFYFDIIERIIQKNHHFLIDLNTELLEAVLIILRTERKLSFTSEFSPAGKSKEDLRYSISPKKKSCYSPKEYLQVFNSIHGFVPGLSIVDLLFNTGPDSVRYL